MKRVRLAIILMMGFLLIGFHDSIFASGDIIDTGQSIKITGDPSTGQHSLCFIDENHGWAVDSGNQDERIIRTTDGGGSWKVVYKTPKGSALTIQKIFFINATAGWMIEQTTDNSPTDGKRTNAFTILKTIDGGKSFVRQTELELINQSSKWPEFDLTFLDQENGYALIYGTLFKTIDGGSSWSKINLNRKGFVPEHMDFVSKKLGWICGTVQIAMAHDVLYVYRTVDGGGSFGQQLRKDYGTDSACATVGIDFIDQYNGWFLTSNYGTMQGDLFHTTDGGKSFYIVSQLRCGRPYPAMICFSDKETGWIPSVPGAGPINGGILRTMDSGKSFQGVTDDNTLEGVSEVEFPSKRIGYATCISVQSEHSGYIMKTTDGGNTWVQIYPRLSPVKAVSFMNDRYGFGAGLPSNPCAILSTADGGKTWGEKYSLLKDFQYVLGLSFLSKKEGYVLAIGKDSNQPFLLKTLDGGNTWMKSKADLSNWKYNQLDGFEMFDARNGVMAWLSGADGTVLFKTEDGGDTWFKSQTLETEVGHICFSSSTSWLFDYRYNYGLLTISRITGQSEEKIASIPATAFLGGQLISKIQP